MIDGHNIEQGARTFCPGTCSKEYCNAYHNPQNRTVLVESLFEEIDSFRHLIHQKIPKKMNLEINVSCKNTKHELVCIGIEEFLNPERKWCSIKLAPDTNIQMVDSYYQKGFRQFHCCNTLKKNELNGSLSGPILIPHTSKLVRSIREKYDDVEIVAGGGIRNIDTLCEYQRLGATHFSVSTLLFNPILFYMFHSRWKSSLQ